MYITKEEILVATNGGLDIIVSYYPQAQECVGSSNKKFRVRSGEKTASASLKVHSDGTYLVTDFGGDSKSRNGIGVCMLEENCDFRTAIEICAGRFNVVSGATAPEILKPEITKRPATDIEENGKYYLEYKDEISELEIETLFSKKVRDYAFNVHKDGWLTYLRKICSGLGFMSLVSFTYVKDGQATRTGSTDRYPIFAIQGDKFTKIYQPKSFDKAFRFRYEGTKPKNYVFGYARFCKDFEEGNRKFIEDKDEDQEESGKKSKSFKLDEVIKCSGDADALNVAALGYHVIWTNSETEHIEWNVWISLTSKAKAVYNLPDIDITGVREAHKMGLAFMEMKTIYLPKSLYDIRDWRGNPCKDVRDYLNHFDAKSFQKLVECALEYKFWDEEAFYDKQGNWKKNVYVFNNVRGYNFLMRCGFYRFESKSAKGGYEYVKITDNVVEIIDAKKIKSYVNDFLKERFTADQTLRNTFYRSPQLKDESLDNLDFIPLDFKYFGKDFQYIFFKNKIWRVMRNQIEEYKAGEINKMVWNTKVIPHRIKMLEPPFEVKEVEHPDGTRSVDLIIHNQDCLFLKYLINTSRIHWRKELEDACDTTYPNKAEAEKYRKENNFNIAGELLTQEEKTEQKRHLLNKIFTLGYMMASYKDPSKAWAPFIMDHKLSSEGESHGGSGKTIFARAPELFKNTLVLDGKSKSLTEDKHAFENVTEQTEIILIDDMSQYLPIEPFFAKITGDLTVNPKFNQRFVLPYDSSPKIVFTSNFGVRNVTPSSERRSLYVSCCDWYHNNLTGDYREERKPEHDFGKNLFKDFTDDEWNLFMNTMTRCLQVYMQIPYMITPPIDNVNKRNLLSLMGDAFMNWADVYFSAENGKLNCMVPRTEAFNEFVKSTNSKLWTTYKFTNCITAWCRYYKYELDPKEFQNGKGRIIRKAQKRDHNGNVVTKMENGQQVAEKTAQEMIFIKTTSEKFAEEFFNEEFVSPVLSGNIVGGNSLFQGDQQNEDEFTL